MLNYIQFDETILYQKETNAFFLIFLDCFDNIDWDNAGYRGAFKYQGLDAEDCNDYTRHHCAYGFVKPGHKNMLGLYYNYPEDNCCACGKGRAGNSSQLL